ncbi:DAK2 domain-containing protein [Niameybacter massiliensis]|uniref:DAK2 domain-containing protein n=1 Tax=Niameybacter massiliensis TaxID=1658108 RepID=UPI0006B54614|nr:DAK2 domain-containing protein [Niameybacter massiliensis]
MKLEVIDAKLLQSMFVAGAKLLDEKKNMVNELNVFPVPDGDTGTNMSLTMLAAAKEVEKVDPTNVMEVGNAAASGSLRGARGNSGVILSQLIRGFAKALTNEPIDTLTLANAFQAGVDTAYKAVMKPKEGTILTVAREVATKAMQLSMEVTDMEEFAKRVLEHGYEVLHQTPDMLPVLKEAGVVDAGGQGLLCILEGAAMVITGDIQINIKKPVSKPNTAAFQALKNFNTEDITFGYCTEFIVNRDPKANYNETAVREYLETIGDSLVAVSDETFIKIHVHTDNPGLALQKGLEFGSLTSIKIENMREQHTSILADGEQVEDKGPRKPLAFVSIVAGEGLVEIMKSLGVDEVIEGGQTMNPSTEDISEAIERAHAEEVIILPNNKNIILAAEQAANIETECHVHVIPSKTIPQGITAMVNHDESGDIKKVVEAMNEAISTVETAQITIAVRDTTIDGQEIKEGEYLGILEGNIVVHNSDLKATFTELLAKMNEEAEIITIYYGEEISEEQAEDYVAIAEGGFPEADVEVHSGGQPVYYFMISAE